MARSCPSREVLIFTAMVSDIFVATFSSDDTNCFLTDNMTGVNVLVMGLLGLVNKMLWICFMAAMHTNYKLFPAWAMATMHSKQCYNYFYYFCLR